MPLTDPVVGSGAVRAWSHPPTAAPPVPEPAASEEEEHEDDDEDGLHVRLLAAICSRE
jgi:hypothetical protein